MNTYVDYKNVDLLKKHLNPYGRIQGKKRTNTASIRQRQIATAVKRARFMALLQYVAE